MKFFAATFVVLLSVTMVTRSNAATIMCGGASQVGNTASDDSTSKEKSSNVNERSDAVAEAAAAADTEAVSTTEPPKSTTTTETSDVKQFFQAVQCTLEKAKPWVEEIEKEAKRLEQTAKRLGEGVISSITELVDKLIGHQEAANAGGSAVVGETVATVDEVATVEKVDKIEKLPSAVKDDTVAAVEVVADADDNLATNEIPLLADSVDQIVSTFKKQVRKVNLSL